MDGVDIDSILMPNPSLLLLDEPLGITSIFVTHDQEEAMKVADLIELD